MNNRERMRASNKKVREWLLEHGFDEVWFKAHTNRSDVVFTQKGSYLATDLWNLWDGIAWLHGHIYFLQMKTNGWASVPPIYRFIQDHHNCRAIVFNVSNQLKGCNGKYKVFTRFYE